MIALLTLTCGPRSADGTLKTLSLEVEDLQIVSPDARFSFVRDLVLTSEAVWVLDNDSPFLTRILLDTGKSASFGREGEGPGEYLNPWAIQPVRTGAGPGVRVWDLGNSRISSVDTLGRPVESDPWSDEGVIRARADIKDVSYADPFRIRSQGDTALVGHFSQRINRTGDIANGSLRVSGHTLSPVGEVARFSDHMEEGAIRKKEWVAVPLWDFCDGTVVLWSPKSGEVMWMDLAGRVIGSVEVRGAGTQVGLEDIEAYLRLRGRLELGPGHESAGFDYPRMAPMYRDRFVAEHPGPTDLRCQSKKVAWIRLFDPSVDPLGHGRAWLRVSRSEDPLRYDFPVGFTPFLFTALGGYGVLEVVEGYQQLAWWSREQATNGRTSWLKHPQRKGEK